jgi:phosphinothricin acetyltransferase
MKQDNNMGSIRTAVLDDAPHIFTIFQQCDSLEQTIRQYQGIGLVDVIDWIESTTDKHPFLVIEYQGDAIAWCSIEPFYGLPAFDCASEISLYVSPTYQRQGLGRQLITHIENHRVDIGFSHLVAYVYESNTSSQGFFARQGFEQWGLLPNIAQDEGITEDVLLLGREF